MSSDLAPNVFVVDDEHVIASTLAAILQMNVLGEVLDLSASGVNRSPLESPDLLISDVAMPGSFPD